MEQLHPERQRDLSFDGFFYTVKRICSNGDTHWRCVTRSCHAALKKKCESISPLYTLHNHDPPTTDSEVFNAIHLISMSALQTEEQPQRIIERTYALLPYKIAAQLPPFANLARTVRRFRRLEEDNSDPSAFLSTISGEPFVRIIEPDFVLCAAVADLDALAESDHLFCDGTFDISPPGFEQVYSINALVAGRVFPCVYAIMKNKT